MEGKSNKLSIFFVVITYLVGIAGFLSEKTQGLFFILVPYHLLLVFALLMLQNKEWNLKFVCFVVITFVLSFLAEYTGVHTGLLFGHYNYGTVLGVKFREVPVMIGSNWVMLIYAASSVSGKITSVWWKGALISGLILTILDIFMEPAAVKLGFWFWTGNIIPVFNYVCWFALSFLFSAVAKLLKISAGFSISVCILLCQMLFFIVLHQCF